MGFNSELDKFAYEKTAKVTLDFLVDGNLDQ